MDATQDPTPQPPETRGRHRDASARRWGARQLVAATAAVVALVVLGGAAALAVAGGPPSPGADPDASPTPATTPRSAPATTAETASPTGPASSAPVSGGLGVHRTVTVRGTVVTVVERYTATDAAPVVLAPAGRPGEPTLVPLSLRLVADDGTVTPFGAPVTVPAGGTTTVRGQYRLRYCPDLVPLAWPSTARVTSPGVPVDVLRSDEPLRTARAICPGVPPRATAAPALRVVRFVGGGAQASVRLAWRGPPTRLVAVGAPSGFPLDTVPRSCGRDCVAMLRRAQPVSLPLRPVDGCPTRFQRSDGLPLLLQRGGRVEVVSVSADGLGRWFVSACR